MYTADSSRNDSPSQPLIKTPHLNCVAVVSVIAMAFVAVAVFLHSPGFHARMVYDSVGYLVDKGDVFARHDPVAVTSMVPQRPLFMLTLYANYLGAGTDASAYRLVNAILLGASGLALAFATWMLLQCLGPVLPGSAAERQWLAVLVGLWFLVHPLQGFAVLYVWQRSVLMACLFSYAAIGTYLAARTEHFRSAVMLYVLCGILFAAGMLSKENVIMVPAILFLAEIVVFKASLRGLLTRGLIIAAITLPGIILNVVSTFLLLGPDTERGQEGLVARVVSYYAMAGVSPLEVVFTQCRAVVAYLHDILVPGPDSLPFLRSFTISRGLLDPVVTLPAVGGIAAALLGAAICCRERPLASFGLLFFLVTLLPESLLIPQYLHFGHRPILPMAGVFLIMTDCAARLLDLNARPSFKSLVAGVLVLPALYWGWVTYERSNNWNPLRFWEESYVLLPEFTPHVDKFAYMDVLGNYAKELSDSGRHAEAVDVLEKAVLIDFGLINEKTVAAKIKLGTELLKVGRADEGLRMLHLVTAETPDYWLAHFHLATARAQTGDRPGAVESLEKAAQLNRKSTSPCTALAGLFMEEGRLPEAIAWYRKALHRDPRSADVFNRLAIALEKRGDIRAAVDTYRNALSIAPRSAVLHFNLAKALAKTGSVPEAIEHYRKAIQLDPSYGPALANLGTMLLKLGRMNEAVVSFERALAIIHNNAELHVQTATALTSLGRKAEARGHLERALAINPRHEGARQYLDRLVTHEPITEKAHP
jgi:protein O-mannosyl-transferase